MLEAIKHPHIIQLKEFYRTKSEKLVLILEFAEGGDLQEVMEAQTESQGSFPQEQILSKITSLFLL